MYTPAADAVIKTLSGHSFATAGRRLESLVCSPHHMQRLQSKLQVSTFLLLASLTTALQVMLQRPAHHMKAAWPAVYWQPSMVQLECDADMTAVQVMLHLLLTT
jgi:hypothetical protein